MMAYGTFHEAQQLPAIIAIIIWFGELLEVITERTVNHRQEALYRICILVVDEIQIESTSTIASLP